MSVTCEIGSRSERAAAEYLLDQGFSLLHMNWRSGHCELDIVATRGDTIHFIEVKSRKVGSLTTPESAITPAKFRSLRKAAAAYIALYNIDLEPQFDLIAVEHTQTNCHIRYVPKAMTTSW